MRACPRLESSLIFCLDSLQPVASQGSKWRGGRGPGGDDRVNRPQSPGAERRRASAAPLEPEAVSGQGRF